MQDGRQQDLQSLRAHEPDLHGGDGQAAPQPLAQAAAAGRHSGTQPEHFNDSLAPVLFPLNDSAMEAARPFWCQTHLQ